MGRTKKIEEKYTSMSEREHILSRSSMYIGSTKVEEKELFIYNNENENIEFKEIKYSPAMLKLVDEIISNSCDEYRRIDNLGLDEVIITINKTTGSIEIEDNGGIPVVMHKEAKVYIPEFIFGQLRTSSNYNDNEDRNVIGTNGLGSVLTNIFSKKFEVESADKKHSIYVEWQNNMSNKSNPIIKTSHKHYTRTKFFIDFDRFEENNISNDFIELLHKRCIDAAAANFNLKIKFRVIENNSKIINTVWKFKNFEDYIKLYQNYIDTENKIYFKNDICEAYIFPDSNIDIAFVNGAGCSKGTHIRALRNEINKHITFYLEKKNKIKDLSPKSVDNKYSVFMNIIISNPTYDSQTKECLTTPIDEFSKNPKLKWKVDEKFLKQIEKSEIVNIVLDWYNKKLIVDNEKTLRKLNKETNKGLKRPDKYITCSSKKKSERQLWIFEGDSAKAGFRTGRNPEIQAGYTMRGVPLNIYGMTPVQIIKNEVFNDLITIIGLKWGKEFNINDLNFGKIVISSDADVDGDKICGLLLLFFNNWPELIEKKIVCRSISPIIISRKGKDCKKFYNLQDFKNEEKKLKGYEHKYTKGLGGLSNQESKEMYQKPIFMYFKKDEYSDNTLKKWFMKDNSDIRKNLLSS